MQANPFTSFEIRIPRIYSEVVKKYCQQSNPGLSVELTPFERQVDFWYFAFLFAVKKELAKAEFDSKDTVNIITGEILSRPAFRVSHMQAAYLSITNDVNGLAEPKKVFDFVSEMANAGIPHVAQILSDSDDKPLFNLFDEIEAVTRS